MSRIDKQLILPLGLLGAMVILIGVAIGTSITRYKIKPAQKMADLAFEVRHEETKYSELRRSAVIMINAYARKGANSVEIYTGDFGLDQREMLKRDLINKGYTVAVTSPLSGKEDFMEISW